MDDLSEQLRTYWTVVGQIAAVFAIPLVIEVRRSVARWRRVSRQWRRVQTGLYFLAALVLSDTVTNSLIQLGTAVPTSGLVPILLRNVAIGFVCFGITVAPIQNYVTMVNRDALIVIQRSMPWSNFRKTRREIRGYHRDFNEHVSFILKTEDMAQNLEELVISLDDRNSDLNQRMVEHNLKLQNLLQEIDPAQLEDGLTPEMIRDALLQAGSDDELESDLRSAAEDLKKDRVDRDSRIIELAGLADRWDEREIHYSLTYLTPELLTTLEADLSEAADDAADQLLNPSSDTARSDALIAKKLDTRG